MAESHATQREDSTKGMRQPPLGEVSVRQMLEEKVRRIARTNEEDGAANTIEILEPWDFSM